jgi:probable biosynthetic protein (TIGR04098 family)
MRGVFKFLALVILTPFSTIKPMSLSILNSDAVKQPSYSSFSLELGMPHLGRHNLSESALFKAIGNDRWKQIENVGGVQSALIHDDARSRLYATFFFMEVHLPREMPLSSFGENCTVQFDVELTHFSKVYLDGRYALAAHPEYGVRASNVFIYQERGPSKLSVSVPVNMDFSRIPELPAVPDSLGLCREARGRGAFLDPLPGDIALFEGEREFVYRIDADRDLNGAGLVYFANFISFLDLAERQLLSAMDRPVPPGLLDGRSTYSRRIGYFGNATSTDSLHILLKAQGQVVRTQHGFSLFDFGFNYRVRRLSDDKEVLVSSCRKVACLEPGSEAETWAASVMTGQAPAPCAF